MIKILNRIKNNDKFDFLLFFLLGSLSLFWFKGSQFISGGTFTWHVNFNEYFQKALYLWENFSTGYSLARMPALLFPYIFYGKILQLFFNNSWFYERILFYVSFSFSGFSAYFLLKTINIRRIPRIIGALFYMFNPFACLVVWYLSIGLYFPFYCFSPLALAFFIKSIKGEMNIALSLLLIFLMPMTASFANPVFFMIFSALLALYTFFILLNQALKKEFFIFKKTLLKFLLFFTLLICLNLFWLIPLLTDVQYQYKIASNLLIGLAGDLSTIKLNSAHFFEIFRILGLWSFNSGENGDYYYPWHQSFNSPFFVLMSYSLVLVVIFGFLKLIKGNFKDKFFWLFSFLIGILFTCAFYSPLAPLFEIFYKKFPFLLRSFRGGYTKFVFFLILPYVVIFSYGLESFYKKFKIKILLFLIPIFVLGFPLITNQVVYHGGEFLRSYLIKIPNDYYLFKGWDKNSKKNGRYLVLPIYLPDTLSFKWDQGYQGADYLRQFSSKAIINNNSTINVFLSKLINLNDSSLALKVLSLLNVQKIIYRDDSNWLSSGDFLTKDKTAIKKFLENFELEQELGIFKIFKIPDEQYLPHFYIAEKIVFSSFGIEFLSQSKNVNESNYQKSAFYNTEDYNNKFTSQMPKEIWLKGKTKKGLQLGKVVDVAWPKKDILWLKANLVYPYVKHHPKSLIYPLVLLKEKFIKYFNLWGPEGEIAKELLYLNKRVSEIIVFDLQGDQLEKALSNYEKGMSNVLSMITDDDEGQMVLNYLQDNKQKLKPRTKDDFWDSLEQNLEKVYVQPPFNERSYILDAPVKGDYQLLVNYEDEVKKDSIALSQGENQLTLKLLEIEIPIEKEWQFVNKDKDKSFYRKNIDNWKSGSLYRITGDYLIERGVIGIILTESRKSYDDSGNETLKGTNLFEEVLGNRTFGKFEKFEVLVRSNQSGMGATFNVILDGDCKVGDLKVEKIIEPSVYAYLADLSPDYKNDNPKITFSRINPTKYKVRVENALKPYILVFSEAFHSGWKVYFHKLNDNQNPIGVMASYFNGQIKESYPQNIFLDKNIFKNYGLKPMAENKHFLVNDYANSWYITPEDVNGETDYEMEIEFVPQRLFHLGLLLTSLTFIFCIAYLIIKRLRRGNEKI